MTERKLLLIARSCMILGVLLWLVDIFFVTGLTSIFAAPVFFGIFAFGYYLGREF